MQRLSRRELVGAVLRALGLVALASVAGSQRPRTPAPLDWAAEYDRIGVRPLADVKEELTRTSMHAALVERGLESHRTAMEALGIVAQFPVWDSPAVYYWVPAYDEWGRQDGMVRAVLTTDGWETEWRPEGPRIFPPEET